MAKEIDYVVLELCARMRDSRIRLGLTQEEYAEEIGISRQAVSKYENGVACPSVHTVSRALDLDSDVAIPSKHQAEVAYTYRHPNKSSISKEEVEQWMMDCDVPMENWPKWN